MNIRKCKHCNTEFDIDDKPKGWMANHSRWCDKNPKRDTYSKNLEYARASKSNFNNQYTYDAIMSEETKEKLRLANIGRTHTEETKKKIQTAALNSKHRRLRKGTVIYNDVMLDSSWELALAKRLDDINVKWIRPEPIEWEDTKGISHNYFPDFYLPDYNLYLDPKNKHAIEVQKEKIKILLTIYKNIVIIESLEECETFSPY